MNKNLFKYSKLLITIYFLFSFFCGYANEKDSLLLIVNNRNVNDTNQIKTTTALAKYYLFEEGNIVNAINTTNKAIKIAEEIKSNLWLGKLHSLLGYFKQNYTTDYEGATKSYFLALNYFDKDNNELDKYTVYLNLGTLYYNYNQHDDAVKYFKEAEKIAVVTKNEDDLATVYFNLGSVYDIKEQTDIAIKYYEKARLYYLKINSEIDLALIDFNIANNSLSINKVNKFIDKTTRIRAIGVYKRVKIIFKKFESDNYYLPTIVNLGGELTEVGSLSEGAKYLLEAEKLATDNYNYTTLIVIYSKLADNFNKRNDFLNESIYLRKLTAAKDSLFVENKSKAIAEVQIKYQTEKVETENEVLQQQTLIKDLEISNRDIELTQSKTIRYALFGGVFILLIFGGFTYKRYKVSQGQKKIIEQQKEIVEIKSKEITDSINYAKRIQDAILPPTSELNKNLKNGFVLYKPKDIVAGDFYWMESLKAVENFEDINQRPKLVLFAAADCTGHGVPGAMVSVVCNSALNRAVGEFNLSKPSQILDKARELVIETFERSDADVKDGMDIALCALHVIENDSSKQDLKYKLEYAGGNNPLWIIRPLRQGVINTQSINEVSHQVSNNTNFEFIEIKPNKQPIGKHFRSEPFANHEVELQPEDTIYIFTDGYVDQFGGEKGKKFKSAQLKEVLMSIQTNTMDEQKDILEARFEQWKGDLEQVDDVCIIGVRI